MVVEMTTVFAITGATKVPEKLARLPSPVPRLWLLETLTMVLTVTLPGVTGVWDKVPEKAILAPLPVPITWDGTVDSATVTRTLPGSTGMFLNVAVKSRWTSLPVPMTSWALAKTSVVTVTVLGWTGTFMRTPLKDLLAPSPTPISCVNTRPAWALKSRLKDSKSYRVRITLLASPATMSLYGTTRVGSIAKETRSLGTGLSLASYRVAMS